MFSGDALSTVSSPSSNPAVAATKTVGNAIYVTVADIAQVRTWGDMVTVANFCSAVIVRDAMVVIVVAEAIVPDVCAVPDLTETRGQSLVHFGAVRDAPGQRNLQ